MLKLVIGEEGEAAGNPAARGVDEPELWRDEDGILFARGYRRGDTHWMELPGIGTFRFGPDQPEVVAAPAPTVAREIVIDAYRRLVLPNALQALGHELLHASAVVTPQGVVALCAGRGTGKSTTAYGLSRRGYPLWADDAVSFEVTGRSAVTSQLPFALRLRPASAAFFGSDGDAAASSEATEPRPLAIIFVLERATAPGDVGGAEILRLAPHEAFIALLANAYWFSLADRERTRRMMGSYLDLSALVPVLRLRFWPELENLDAILERVELELSRLEKAK